MKADYNKNIGPMADTSYNVHEAILGMLKAGKGKVLDLGAGFGLLSKKIGELGYDVTACELDPVRISHIRKIGLKCDKVDLNCKLPYNDRLFDIVISSDVIEHLTRPYDFIQEIGRVTKKGGMLIITTPNIMNWYSRIKFLFSGIYNNYFTEKEFEGDGYHITPLHHLQLRFMLNRAGFVVEGMKSNQCTGLINCSSAKIFVASLLLLPVRGFMKPRNKILLEGDILIVQASKVK